MKLVCDLLLLRSISTSDTNSFSAEVLITKFIQQLNYNVKGQRLMDIGHQHALEISKRLGSNNKYGKNAEEIDESLNYWL